MVKEMQTLLQRRGYNSIIFNTEEKAAMERQAITTSLSQNVDGIILCPAPGGEENIRFLQMHGKPFVMIGRHFSGEDASYVVCDDVHGGYAAAGYLLDRGHRDILFLNGPKGISSSAERLKGYRMALEERGIPFRSDLVETVPVASRRGTEKMKEILSRQEKYTAVLVFNDILAWQVICILGELGRKVPETCSVVGFDNIKYPYPVHLTSVSSSKTTMAKRSVEILMKKLEGQKGDAEECVVLETAVVEGGTVAGA